MGECLDTNVASYFSQTRTLLVVAVALISGLEFDCARLTFIWILPCIAVLMILIQCPFNKGLCTALKEAAELCCYIFFMRSYMYIQIARAFIALATNMANIVRMFF